MKIVLAIAVVAATFWVWTHHTTTDAGVCLSPPARICIERAPDTADLTTQ